MTIYMVQVVSPKKSRYFDSFWAVEATAQERVAQLATLIEAGGTSVNSTDVMTWRVRVIRAQVEDAALMESAATGRSPAKKDQQL